MPEFLVDTDVLIDHLRIGSGLPTPPERTAYSSLTRAELYAGRHVDEAVVDDLLSILSEVPVDRPIAEEGGRLRRAHGIGLADAIIAATAIVTGRTLLTRNDRDFRSVRGLRRRSP
ncbi:MAG TPA: PIN domain-containing protein [Actinomycetota bacterium]